MKLPPLQKHIAIFFMLILLFIPSACASKAPAQPPAPTPTRGSDQPDHDQAQEDVVESATRSSTLLEVETATAVATAADAASATAAATATATETPPDPTVTATSSPITSEPATPTPVLNEGEGPALSETEEAVPDQYTYAMAFGGTGYDKAAAIEAVSSGGSVIAGAYSTDGSGDNDPWVIRLDPYGEVLWQTVYAGAKSDSLADIQETSDGGFILAGSSSSPEKSSFEALVLKLEKDGKIAWQKTIGGLQNEFAYAVRQTRDGGYIVAGETSLFYTTNEADAWIIKLDRSGNVTWQRSYGGAKDDRARDIVETDQGDFIFAGATESFGGRNANAWVVKLDSQGDLLWQFAYGGDGSDSFNTLHLMEDGGLILNGYTTGDNFYNDSEIWVVSLEEDGAVSWSKTYGDVKNDKGADLRPTSDGGFLVTGFSEFEGYIFKLWVLKLDGQGEVAWSRHFGIKGWNVGVAVTTDPDGGFLVAGNTDSLGIGGWYDVFLLKLNQLGQIPGCPVVQDFDMFEIQTVEIPVTASAAAYKTTLINPVGGSLSPRPAPYQGNTICTYPETPPIPTLTPTTDPSIPLFTRKLYLQSPAMSGEDVVKVQERLFALGYTEVGTPDGYFGKMTDQAVRHFQEVNGLLVDGIIGENTWTLLFSADALGPA